MTLEPMAVAWREPVAQALKHLKYWNSSEQNKHLQHSIDDLTRLLASLQPHTGRAGVTDEMVEAACRAVARDHYAKRFGKSEDDPHVTRNVDGNWNIFSHETRIALNAALTVEPEAGEVTVKPLEWAQNWPNDPLTAYARADHINRTYTVDHDGPRFYLNTGISPSYDTPDGIGNFASLDEAKAAAQADYTARIRSALAP